MSIFDFGSEKKRLSNKRVKAIVGSSLLVATLVFGSTLAATISINTGPVEFGQGVASTTACSGDTPISVTPKSTFYNIPASNLTVTTSQGEQIYQPNRTPRGDFYFNFGISNDVQVVAGSLVTGVGIDPDTYVEVTNVGDYTLDDQVVWLSKELNIAFTPGQEVTFSGGGHYVMSSIAVSNIPDSCNGVDFTIKSYGKSGQLSHLVAGDCFNYYQSSGWDGRSAVVKYDASNLESVLTENTYQADISLDQADHGFEITLGGVVGDSDICSGPPASDVYKITIESSKKLSTTFATMLDRCVTNLGGTFTRSEIIADLGYDSEASANSDYDTQRLLLHIAGINEPLIGGMSYDNSNVLDLFCGNSETNLILSADSFLDDLTDAYRRDLVLAGGGDDTIDEAWGANIFGGAGDDLLGVDNEDNYLDSIEMVNVLDLEYGGNRTFADLHSGPAYQ